MAEKEVTLPSGVKVTLKDPNLLRVKDRKKLYESSEVEGGELTRALALGDAIIAMLVIKWSIDAPIPSESLESLDEMKIPDYDFLVEETKDAQKFIFPSLAGTLENELDPKAITEVSKG